MQGRDRITTIVARYGWRAPAIVIALLADRLHAVERITTWMFLNTLTLGQKGRGIRIERGVRISPGGFIALADDVVIGARSVLEVSVDPPGRLSIGSRTWLSHDSHIACWGTVNIGSDVLVGEFTTIRDTSHRHESVSAPIRVQGDVTGSIIIEDGVWIGRGVAVVAPSAGLLIGTGAIVGANSVVLESVPAYAVVVGAPAKVVRSRLGPANPGTRQGHAGQRTPIFGVDDTGWKPC